MQKTERNHFFDSLKFTLIFLVVFGHVMEYDIYEDHTRMTFFTFIYTFHMPLFIFISGYFSKNMSWGKYKKSFVALFSTYVLFQFIYSIPSILLGKFDLINFILIPNSVLWYIVGLLFWRLLFCFIPKAKIPFPILLSLSFIVSILSCYFFTTSNLLMKLLHFSPFFILGYYCSMDKITKIRSWNKIHALIISILVLISIYLFADKWLILTIFGDFPSIHYPENYNVLLLKITSYLLGILMSVCIINLATTKFHKQGSSTLTIYLLHPMCVYFVYKEFINRNFELATWLMTFDLVAAILITILYLYLDNFKIIKYITNPILVIRKDKKV